METEKELQMLALTQMIEDTKLEIFSSEAEIAFFSALEQEFATRKKSQADGSFSDLNRSKEVVQRRHWLLEVVDVHRHNLKFYESRLKSGKESQ